MKKIHKLVLKSFMGPLLITFSISMLVLMMQFLWKYVDDLVGKGLEITVVLRFLYYAALTVVPMALPITVLLASLMAMGNMGERYELVAIKSAGISLQKVIRPLMIFAIGISFVAFLFSNNVYPYAFLKYRTLLYDIQMKKPALNIREGEYYKRIDGYVIRFDKKESDGKTIHGVQIYDHTDGLGNVRVTMSKSGLMETSVDGKFLQFTLYDGYSYAEDVKDYKNRHRRPFSRIKFEQQTIRFDLSSFEMGQSDEALFSSHEKNKNLSELQAMIDTLSLQYMDRVTEISNNVISRYGNYQAFYKDTIHSEGLTPIAHNLPEERVNADILHDARSRAESLLGDVKYYVLDLQNREAYLNDYEIEGQRKFTFSLACLLLFLVGAPLGAIIRRGGLGMPVVVSVLIFIAYHAISKIGEITVTSTDLAVWKGMWVSAFIFLPIGLFLLFKATTDAAFLDADVWKRKILKLLGRK